MLEVSFTYCAVYWRKVVAHPYNFLCVQLFATVATFTAFVCLSLQNCGFPREELYQINQLQFLGRGWFSDGCSCVGEDPLCLRKCNSSAWTLAGNL